MLNRTNKTTAECRSLNQRKFLSSTNATWWCCLHLLHLKLPPFKFFLCRLWRQQAINRILISTKPVPEDTPINIKRPLDVFMNGLPVVSVCCVVRTDMDGCGATDFVVFSIVILWSWVIFHGREMISRVKSFQGNLCGKAFQHVADQRLHARRGEG